MRRDASIFRWTRDLSVGVPVIDAQHQELFDRAARLEAAAAAGGSPAELQDLFAFLLRYVRVHFECEEALMRDLGYPGWLDHAREHAELARGLELLLPIWRDECDSETVVGVLLDFLRAWLVEHVGSTDRRLAAFARAHAGPRCAARASA